MLSFLKLKLEVEWNFLDLWKHKTQWRVDVHFCCWVIGEVVNASYVKNHYNWLSWCWKCCAHIIYNCGLFLNQSSVYVSLRLHNFTVRCVLWPVSCEQTHAEPDVKCRAHVKRGCSWHSLSHSLSLTLKENFTLTVRCVWRILWADPHRVCPW